MKKRKAGRYEHICPSCGHPAVFVVADETLDDE
jgi:hypothetical protein